MNSPSSKRSCVSKRVPVPPLAVLWTARRKKNSLTIRKVYTKFHPRDTFPPSLIKLPIVFNARYPNQMITRYCLLIVSSVVHPIPPRGLDTAGSFSSSWRGGKAGSLLSALRGFCSSASGPLRPVEIRPYSFLPIVTMAGRLSTESCLLLPSHHATFSLGRPTAVSVPRTKNRGTRNEPGRRLGVADDSRSLLPRTQTKAVSGWCRRGPFPFCLGLVSRLWWHDTYIYTVPNR